MKKFIIWFVKQRTVGYLFRNWLVTLVEWWGAGVVICLERGADLHMVQLIPLPLTVSCFSKIQIGFTFLVPAHQVSPGKRAVKWVCVCGKSTHHLSWQVRDVEERVTVRLTV